MSMSNEKRFVLCMVLMVLWMLAWPYMARRMGLMSEAKKPPADAVVAKDAEKKEEPAAKPEGDAKPEIPKAKEPAKALAQPAKALAQPAEPPPKKPEVELVDDSELVLGSVNDHDPAGYRLEAQLIQKGAGIDVLTSSRFDDEFENGVDRQAAAETDPARYDLAAVALPDAQCGRENGPPGATRGRRRGQRQRA